MTTPNLAYQDILVSVSGGKTSLFMAHELKRKLGHACNMKFVFANTGEEWEETLIFMDRCDREWSLNCVWVEAEVHPEDGVGTTHKIVTFETASRNGEPFERVISKYGIPNKSFPHCTRELKFRPIHSYIRSLGWTNYLTAIGIRADEPKRINPKAQESHILYPLVDWLPTSKGLVNDWWEDQPFNLDIQPHQGNCKWCWKKSLKKLVRIAKETPDVFDFPARMEREYASVGAWKEGMPHKRTFFREFRSTKDILGIAEILDMPRTLNFEDQDDGCSESCEAQEAGSRT